MEDLTVRQAGRRGGLAVLLKYGKSYFSKIGRKGQDAMRIKYPGMATVWGRRGGRPKKPDLYVGTGEQGEK
jgi:hypothetical protein